MPPTAQITESQLAATELVAFTVTEPGASLPGACRLVEPPTAALVRAWITELQHPHRGDHAARDIDLDHIVTSVEALRRGLDRITHAHH